ncbi:MAG: choice-of-anchor D domain-containing protein, partial [Verrucomicrobiota bacterium]
MQGRRLFDRGRIGSGFLVHLILFFFAFMAPCLRGQVLIYQESFEAPPSPSTYSANFFNDQTPNAGVNDYWDRVTNGFSTTKHGYTPGTITAQHGTNFVIGEDSDDNGNPTGDMFGYIRTQPVDVSSHTGLSVVIAFQDGAGDYELADYFEVWVSTNGAPTNLLLQYRGDDTDACTFSNAAGDCTSSMWEDYTSAVPVSGSASITSLAVEVRLRTTAGGEDAALDNLRIFGSGVGLTTAVINVVGGNGSTISNGASTPSFELGTEFPVSLNGLPETRQFTIKNEGVAPLHLGGVPRVQISGDSEFTVTAQPGATVPAGGESTFSITFAASGAGVRTGLVSILHDAPGTTPYTFVIRGTVLELSDWTRESKITICGYDRPGVLTNFPIQIRLGTNIAGFSYGEFASSSGYDLRFLDAGKSNFLDHDIDTWTTNGESAVWVKIPELQGSTTCIYAIWGAPNQTNPPPPSVRRGTWSEDYLGVWHFSSSSFIDASGNGNAAVPSGGPSIGLGQVGGAVQLDGTSQSLNAGGGLAGPSNVTVIYLYNLGNPGTDDHIFSMYESTAVGGGVRTDEAVVDEIEVYDDLTANDDGDLTSILWSQNVWQFGAATLNAAGLQEHYIHGAISVGTQATDGG